MDRHQLEQREAPRGGRPAEPIEGERRVVEIPEGDLGAALVGAAVGDPPEVFAAPAEGFEFTGGVEDADRIIRRRDDGFQSDEQRLGGTDLSCLGDGDVDDLVGQLGLTLDDERSSERREQAHPQRCHAVADQVDRPTQQFDGRPAGEAGDVGGQFEQQGRLGGDIGRTDPGRERERLPAALAARPVQADSQPHRRQFDKRLGALEIRDVRGSSTASRCDAASS